MREALKVQLNHLQGASVDWILFRGDKLKITMAEALEEGAIPKNMNTQLNIGDFLILQCTDGCCMARVEGVVGDALDPRWKLQAFSAPGSSEPRRSVSKAA